MKGILLAGGRGTRLYPLTQTISKQLLPVYDKPMIYYPLSTLMDFGIKDILIISTPRDIPLIEELLGNGSQFGINLSYAIQESPDGIAQAFIIAKNFLKSTPEQSQEQICLILGDNIFYMGEQHVQLVQSVKESPSNQATIFAYHVSNPARFGVVEFDENFKAVSIVEKPKHPKSNFVSVGLYFYPYDVVEKAEQLKPSARGELEITDLNNIYLKEGRLAVTPMHRGNAWLDAGTPESLMESSAFVHIIEKRQGLKIACLEEIAFKQGFINKEQLQKHIDSLKESTYRSYLIKVLEDA